MQQHVFEHQAPQWRAQALAVSQACGATATEADDVAQDVLLKLWLMHESLEQYRSVQALVSVMARNLTIDMLRRSTTRATVTASPPEPADTAADPAQRLIDAEQEHHLMAMLGALPSRQHAVLVMRQVEHRSYAEIGALMGIGQASAKTLLSRARKALLQRMSNRNSES